jgi:mannosyl-oligosaccharide alpha-1,2-mannosidase
MPAFGSKSGIPFSDVNLKTHEAKSPKWTDDSSLAEVSTLALEFNYLANLTGNWDFAQKAQEVCGIVWSVGYVNNVQERYWYSMTAACWPTKNNVQERYWYSMTAACWST